MNIKKLAALDVTVSKFMSKILRHSPEEFGVSLEEGGWTSTESVLKAIQGSYPTLQQSDIERIVSQCPKQRYALNESKTKIRANQGHSTEVKLDFEERTPPELLFHGTGQRTVPLIIAHGIQKMSRHHVHLSQDRDTAKKVGSRHGKPVVLEIKALQMHKDGHKFYISENNVWLTDNVPVKYIEVVYESV